MLGISNNYLIFKILITAANRENDYELYLSGGSPTFGWPEIYLDEKPGLFCDDAGHWTNDHADALCKLMGHESGR